MKSLNDRSLVLGVIGLGYVGLPLAVEFGKKYRTIGFDINESRINELSAGIDRTKEVEKELLESATYLEMTSDIVDLKDVDVYIVTVPTPIDNNKRPDLSPLVKATETVGKLLKEGNVVIYESTVFPGCTEEVCVPILEKMSQLKFNEGFYCGYSPERINPGDKVHTVTKILKITSGSTPEVAEFVDQLYGSIIEAGTYKTESIKVAEAAKVIENCQRDVNIAFVNELALIFDRLNIDTTSVLKAAGTKWNFLPFTPGLVGGHCIGVDPYYLTYKAEEIGYHPEVILSGRRINDNMGLHVANKVIKLLIKNGIAVKESRILNLGITFKENCPDIRNSRVIDIIRELDDFGSAVEVYDPWASKNEVLHEYGINLFDEPTGKYDAIILAVAHEDFRSVDLDSLLNPNGIVFDIKSFFEADKVTARL